MAKKLTPKDIIDIWEKDFLPDDFDFRLVYPFLESHELGVRSAAVKILIDDDSTKKDDLLLDLLYEEEDEIIRCDIINSFLSSESPEVLEALFETIEEDESYLVRIYGIMFYWEVYFNINPVEDDSIIEIFDTFLLFFSNEEEEHVLVTLAEYLYILGDEDKLDFLLDNLESEDYNVRSSVLKTLKKIIDRENIKDILEEIAYVVNYEDVSWLKKDMKKLLTLDINNIDYKYLEDFIYD